MTRTALLLLSAVALVASLDVQARPRHGRVSRHSAAHAVRPHLATIPEPPAVASQPDSLAYRAREDRIPTAFSRRLGRTRLVGALGYNRAVARWGLDPHELNGAAATQLAQPEGSVGGQVSVAF